MLEISSLLRSFISFELMFKPSPAPVGLIELFYYEFT